ncbi:glycoside hydrolase family 47 protein [Nemania sp. FL0916]|nr:glycoside hydrolase family 47 protein [Nemania sp. FL0916]
MFRLRRYRYYVFFAAIVVFLLYRVARNSEQWETVAASFPHVVPPPNSKPPPISESEAKSHVNAPLKGISSQDDELPQRILDNPPKDNYPVKIPTLSDSKNTKQTDGNNDKHIDIGLAPNTDGSSQQAGVLAYDHDGATKVTTPPVINVPDKAVGQGVKDAGNLADKVIHWKKTPENFPVPEADIIPLPTGKPKKLPTIQYAFEKESPEKREKREARQQKVKAEMERSWAGYWTYAKGHDELSPVTKKFRDPFCGWAATLVDSLDTLWIMGMEEEFKEALVEVEKIDFTVAKRPEIPVFETTIRYLGGFLAAYDVSGGKSGGFDILLQKAIELAEILMGAFDTPNRMPVLYYNWKPGFASQPRRAGTSASVAELGSLAMEFTRLAQITKENKYYDAVARITDAFYEWQERGTSLSGIFPEQIDASGCNRTAQSELEAAVNSADAAMYDKTDGDSNQSTGTMMDDELDVGSELRRKGQHAGSDDTDSHMVKRSVKSSALNLNVARKKNPITGKVELVAGEATLPECVSQGLTPGGWGMEQYSMGGSQDSTYEYFPKQWLLLGGLEPKYKELHLKVSEAVKKWLLYRPMVPDDRDILFTGKIVTSGEPEADATLQYEVTHLTCFIGGMFGLGGKIFEVPADVEIGQKLTEGCVWAYESTATGIMPEGAHVLACRDAKNCHWDETRYGQALDPSYKTRDQSVDEYYERKKKEKAQAKAKAALEQEKEKARAKAALEQEEDDLEDQEDQEPKHGLSSSKNIAGRPKNSDFDQEQLDDSQPDDDDDFGLRKRGPISDAGTQAEDASEKSRIVKNKKVKNTAVESEDMEDSDPAPGFKNSKSNQVPLQEDEDRFEDDPLRPLTHKEYVADRIKNEHLPKGIVDVNSKAYILRPEAIESVWYMYRITGDKKWQDKGWKMFEAIVRHTATEAGNSAIDNVLATKPTHLNEMESFWPAETLKYFYLLYSEPNKISLDDWVLNTEAHPFKRPKTPFGA